LRANRSLRKLKTYLARVIRDIGRRIDGDPELEEIFARPLSLSRRVLAQDQRQRGPKVYSLHAPEVQCDVLQRSRNGGRQFESRCLAICSGRTLRLPSLISALGWPNQVDVIDAKSHG
jgi:hypothetical protein